MTPKITICPDMFERAGNPWGPVADQPGVAAKARHGRDFKAAPRSLPIHLGMVAKHEWNRLTARGLEVGPVPHKPLAIRVIPVAAEIDPWDAGEIARRSAALAADHARAVEAVRNVGKKS